MIRKVMFICLVLSTPSHADITGAGDMAILAELTTQTKKILEQIKTATEALNVSKRLEEMEQVKTIRKISKEVIELKKMFTNIQAIEKELSGFIDDPLGAGKTVKEIERLQKTLEKAKQLEGTAKGKALATIVKDLERLKFIGQAHKATMKKATENGLNEEDSIKATASNTLLMTDLLISQEERKTIRKSIETEAVLDLMQGVSYSSMVPDDG